MLSMTGTRVCVLLAGVSRHSASSGIATREPLADGADLLRTASKRISAKDGSLILSRYVQKAGSQDDDVEGMT